MQQTLLALLALLIATLLSFNQKQANIQDQAQVFRAEMEDMAVGVAARSAQIIRSRPFDAATAGVPADSLVPTEEFADSSEFPESEHQCAAFTDDASACETVESFHKASGTVTFTFPTGSFEFEIDVETQYVDENLQPSSTPTDQKQITFEVQDKPSSGADPRLPSPIEYSEVVTYP